MALPEARETSQTAPMPPISEGGAATAASYLPSFDGFQVLGPLGQGGMGTVWRATQLSTGRQVALKLMNLPLGSAEKAVARFQREVELSARLNHPNIARVYDSGIHHGIYFYAMELIGGVPFDEYVATTNMSQRGVLALFVTAALAVQHAHQHGVIHRDLKPSNMLITEDGQPHLLDFGLAKLVEEDSRNITIDTDVLGTPAFMSPEQASGRMSDLDTRSDIYSLGATLFLLVTGHCVHDDSGSRFECIRRIAEEEPRRPRAFAPSMDLDLEAILLKALARDPEARYRSAAEFAQDIENYLSGDPVTARRAGALYFLRKRLRKHWLAVSTAAAVVLVFVTFAALSFARIAREKAVAQQQASIARVESDKQQAINAFLNDMLGSANPWSAPDKPGPGKDMTVLQACDAAVRQLDGGALKDRPVIEAEVRATLGETYSSLAQHTMGRIQLEKALRLARQAYGSEHSLIAKVSIGLGNYWYGVDDTIKAEPYLREGLAMTRRLHGDNEWAIHVQYLTRVLLSLKKPAEAEQLAREAYAIEPIKGGRAMAQVWMAQKKYAEAEQFWQMALATERRLWGNEHPGVGSALYDLGEVQLRAGKFAEAEAAYREAIAIRLKAQPDSALLATHQLARCLQGQGRLREVDATYRDAITLYREGVGQERTAKRIISAWCNVLIAQRQAGDPRVIDPVVEAFCRRVLERDRSDNGPNPSLALAMTDFGMLLESCGRLAEAEVQYRDALAMRRVLFGEGAREVSSSLTQLTEVLKAQGKSIRE